MAGEAWTASVDRVEECSALRRSFVDFLRSQADDGADIDAAEIIFSELLSNALRYGKVRLSLAWSPDGALLRVRDRGEPFRLPAYRAPDLAATGGRGLFLVRQLAKRLSYERVGDGNVANAVLPVLLRRRVL
jgi:anti-sigma regulatory factor (Ser/Thr protein kinase)